MPLEIRRVSDTALCLPIFGFGGVPIGELYRKVSEDEAQHTLAAAWEAGIRDVVFKRLQGSRSLENQIRNNRFPPGGFKDSSHAVDPQGRTFTNRIHAHHAQAAFDHVHDRRGNQYDFQWGLTA